MLDRPQAFSNEGLLLANPTDQERIRTWTTTHPQFGSALSLESYIDREALLLSLPPGGSTPWILTTAKDADPAVRPVLSTSDTVRRRALVRVRDGTITDVYAHGIASVFTYPEARRKGHAGRMTEMLAETLRTKELESPGQATFSVSSYFPPRKYVTHLVCRIQALTLILH